MIRKSVNQKRKSSFDEPWQATSALYHRELASIKRRNGAGDGIRTHDPNLGKVVLYP